MRLRAVRQTIDTDSTPTATVSPASRPVTPWPSQRLRLSPATAPSGVLALVELICLRADAYGGRRLQAAHQRRAALTASNVQFTHCEAVQCRCKMKRQLRPRCVRFVPTDRGVACSHGTAPLTVERLKQFLDVPREICG